jgi:hypothetical protein
MKKLITLLLILIVTTNSYGLFDKTYEIHFDVDAFNTAIDEAFDRIDREFAKAEREDKRIEREVNEGIKEMGFIEYGEWLMREGDKLIAEEESKGFGPYRYNKKTPLHIYKGCWWYGKTKEEKKKYLNDMKEYKKEVKKKDDNKYLLSPEGEVILSDEGKPLPYNYVPYTGPPVKEIKITATKKKVYRNPTKRSKEEIVILKQRNKDKKERIAAIVRKRRSKRMAREAKRREWQWYVDRGIEYRYNFNKSCTYAGGGGKTVFVKSHYRSSPSR